MPKEVEEKCHKSFIKVVFATLRASTYCTEFFQHHSASSTGAKHTQHLRGLNARKKIPLYFPGDQDKRVEEILVLLTLKPTLSKNTFGTNIAILKVQEKSHQQHLKVGETAPPNNPLPESPSPQTLIIESFLVLPWQFAKAAFPPCHLAA